MPVPGYLKSHAPVEEKAVPFVIRHGKVIFVVLFTVLGMCRGDTIEGDKCLGLLSS
jgi:hypothetical protein